MTVLNDVVVWSVQQRSADSPHQELCLRLLTSYSSNGSRGNSGSSDSSMGSSTRGNSSSSMARSNGSSSSMARSSGNNNRGSNNRGSSHSNSISWSPFPFLPFDYRLLAASKVQQPRYPDYLKLLLQRSALYLNASCFYSRIASWCFSDHCTFLYLVRSCTDNPQAWHSFSSRLWNHSYISLCRSDIFSFPLGNNHIFR